MPCPFKSKLGFSTLDTHNEFLEYGTSTDDYKLIWATNKLSSYTLNDSEHKDDAEEKKELSPPPQPRNSKLKDGLLLEGSLDINEPLYIWQLYSIIGPDPILAVCRQFYTNIFNDPEDWFRLAWQNVTVDPSDIEFHVSAMSKYWIDSFGGGPKYWGGTGRLTHHHTSRHADPVMNERGAKRWAQHMKHAIRSVNLAACNEKVGHDPRILPCLVEFLRVKVQSYAHEFNFEFDASDYKIEDFEYVGTAADGTGSGD